jgi:hypothetical protein
VGSVRRHIIMSVVVVVGTVVVMLNRQIQLHKTTFQKYSQEEWDPEKRPRRLRYGFRKTVKSILQKNSLTI